MIILNLVLVGWCVVLITVSVLRMDSGRDNNVDIIMFISSVACLVLNIIALVLNIIALDGNI